MTAEQSGQPDPRLAQARDLLVYIRGNRPAERLHAKHLAGRETAVAMLTGMSEGPQARESFVQAVVAAVQSLGVVDDLPADTARQIGRQILLDPILRSTARNNLADAFRQFTRSGLRKDGGLEDDVMGEVARLSLVELDSIRPPQRNVVVNELVFGFTMWLGTRDTDQRREFENALIERNYHIVNIKVSALISQIVHTSFQVETKSDDLVQYLTERMDAGDHARELGLGIMAELAVQEIVHKREQYLNSLGDKAPAAGIAYIVDSLMHHEEVKLLRSTYGSRFFLIAFYEDEQARRAALLGSTGAGRSRQRLHNEGSDSTVEKAIDVLLARNRGRGRRSLVLPQKRNELAVEQVFHRADVFVDVSDPGESRELSNGRAGAGLSTFTIRRFVDQVFSHPFNTPTRHELGMAHAVVEATRSGAITRQVGAAICTWDGELVAVGTNEAPAAGGGQYPQVRKNRAVDYRDQKFSAFLESFEDGERSVDPNDDIKMELLRELLEGLCALGVVKAEDGTLFDTGIADARKQSENLVVQYPQLKNARIFDIIEYTRMVHAEMSAILGAMRRGISVDGCVLYCTAFPCHECARHIIMSGIARVVYIEPYPKSRVVQIHPEAVSLGHKEVADPLDKLEFLPFIGISPSRQPDLYSPLPRRHLDQITGRSSLVSWSQTRAILRPTIDSSDDPQQQALEEAGRRTKESAIIARLQRRIKEA